jgi:hypothetical protein
VARGYLLAMGLYSGQLLWTGHWVMAPVILILTVVTLFAMRRMTPQDAAAPRRLLLAADGRMHVATIGGSIEPVEMAGESLWLGSALLLVLQASGHRHRLLLGRGNLDPTALATLRRRLRGAAIASVDPAVDSSTVSGQGASVVEQLTTGIPFRGS